MTPTSLHRDLIYALSSERAAMDKPLQTFEDQARESMCGLDGPPTMAAAEHYTRFFLMDYAKALAGQSVGAVAFIKAYTYKIRALQNGATIEFLDEEGYRMRQEWARLFDKHGVMHDA